MVAALSRDGSTAVGTCAAAAFRWDWQAGIAAVGPAPCCGYGTGTFGRGVSADGSVVVGSQPNVADEATRVWKWTQAGGIQFCPAAAIRPHDLVGVSDDGSVAIGIGDSQVFSGFWRQRVLRWGPAGAGALGGGAGVCWDYTAFSTAVSSNGAFVGGWYGCDGMSGTYPPSLTGSPLGISGDGTVIVGLSNDDRAFSWTSAAGSRSLGGIRGFPETRSRAVAASMDGSVIVGFLEARCGGERLAFVWTQASGMVDLKRLLVWQGAAGVSGWVLVGGSAGPTAISGDGLTIAGVGIDPQGHGQGWVARLLALPTAPLPPPCSADFNGDCDLGTDSDIEAFFACLAGTCCPTCGSADFNADGDLGTDGDIEAFFRVLGGGSC